ncbi:MAG: DEAD/DEAH box helicase family protein [Ekhidna sp.]|nr:DEAD/DEAH box helicase family protein [Ekhidna sp.]
MKNYKKLSAKIKTKVQVENSSARFEARPRDYQKEAINRWVKNNYQGFFEMATGTGKTFTGLFASLTLKEKINKCFLLILVPTISLAEQWKGEVKKVGYSSVTVVSSNHSNWERTLINTINAFKLGTLSQVVCISTYDSYKTIKFQLLLSKLPKETMLIADEAHAMGAPQMLQNLPVDIQYRLGLSATPHRHFDDSGTEKLLTFFNAKDDPTYKLDLKKAIADKFLCQYKLYPHVATLSDSEYEEYKELSKRIAKKAHINNHKLDKTDYQLEKLLRDRRNILNRAQAKLPILGEIIDSIKESHGEVKHTLIYCPEGNTPDEDARIIDEYGKYIGLEKELKIGKFVGETPPEERQKLLEDFENGDIQCLLAMKCLDEGVDVKQTKIAIFLASNTNPRQYIQRRGRVLRTHSKKSFAHLHDILTLPPKLPEDERLLEIERTIINQEFNRYREFSEDAINYVEAIEPLKPIVEKYALKL